MSRQLIWTMLVFVVALGQRRGDRNESAEAP